MKRRDFFKLAGCGVLSCLVPKLFIKANSVPYKMTLGGKTIVGGGTWGFSTIVGSRHTAPKGLMTGETITFKGRF